MKKCKIKFIEKIKSQISDLYDFYRDEERRFDMIKNMANDISIYDKKKAEEIDSKLDSHNDYIENKLKEIYKQIDCLSTTNKIRYESVMQELKRIYNLLFAGIIGILAIIGAYIIYNIA